MPELPITVTVEDAKSPGLLFRLLTVISQKINDLANKIEKLSDVDSFKFPTFADIRKALQATGSTPINVTGLRGVLADPQPASALRYDTAPTGQLLQQLSDTQLLVVKNGTSYDLYHVLGGNPNTLFKLIAGAGGGNMMTTDTDQTMGAGVNKTWQDDQTFEDILMTGKMTQYNGITTTKGGVPSILASAEATNQTANIGTTTLYTTPTPAAYMYIALVTLTTNTAGAAGSTVNASIAWTDTGGTNRGHLAVAHNNGAFGCDLTAATGTATGIAVVAIPGNATNISYSTVGTYNTTAAYNIYIELLAL